MWISEQDSDTREEGFGHKAGYLLTALERLAPLQRELLHHRVYRQLDGPSSLRIFCDHHCFVVWERMSLAKTLQRRLTCQRVPWVPPRNGRAARAINEVVTYEESESLLGGALVQSRFESYLMGMAELGANTLRLRTLLEHLSAGIPVQDVLGALGVPDPVARFIRVSLSHCRVLADHQLAGAFYFGDVALMPAVFEAAVSSVASEGPPLPALSRWFELDVERAICNRSSAPYDLLEALCGDSAERWLEATEAAEATLHLRIAIWDAISETIEGASALPAVR